MASYIGNTFGAVLHQAEPTKHAFVPYETIADKSYAESVKFLIVYGFAILDNGERLVIAKRGGSVFAYRLRRESYDWFDSVLDEDFDDSEYFPVLAKFSYCEADGSYHHQIRSIMRECKFPSFEAEYKRLGLID